MCRNVVDFNYIFKRLQITNNFLIQWHFEQDNHAVMQAALTFALHLSVPRQLVHTLQARRIPWQVSGVSNKPS